MFSKRHKAQRASGLFYPCAVNDRYAFFKAEYSLKRTVVLIFTFGLHDLGQYTRASSSRIHLTAQQMLLC